MHAVITCKWRLGGSGGRFLFRERAEAEGLVDYGYAGAGSGEPELQELFFEAVLQNLMILRRGEAD